MFFDTFLPVVSEQVIEVPKTTLQDRTSQRTALRERQLVEQLVVVPTVVYQSGSSSIPSSRPLTFQLMAVSSVPVEVLVVLSQNRAHWRLLMESLKILSKDRVPQRFVAEVLKVLYQDRVQQRLSVELLQVLYQDRTAVSRRGLQGSVPGQNSGFSRRSPSLFSGQSSTAFHGAQQHDHRGLFQDRVLQSFVEQNIMITRALSQDRVQQLVVELMYVVEVLRALLQDRVQQHLVVLTLVFVLNGRHEEAAMPTITLWMRKDGKVRHRVEARRSQPLRTVFQTNCSSRLG